MRRQHRSEDYRAHGIPAASHLEQGLGRQFPDAGGAGALPVGPRQAQGDAVTAGTAGLR